MDRIGLYFQQLGDLLMNRDKAGRLLSITGWLYILFGVSGFLLLLIFRYHDTLVKIVEAEFIKYYGTTQLRDMEYELIDEILFYFYLIMVLLVVINVIFYALCGYLFIKAKYYRVCFVSAVLTCLAFPPGTLLGIFSIVLLRKPEIRRMYGRSP